VHVLVPALELQEDVVETGELLHVRTGASKHGTSSTAQSPLGIPLVSAGRAAAGAASHPVRTEPHSLLQRGKNWPCRHGAAAGGARASSQRRHRSSAHPAFAGECRGTMT